MDTVETGKQFEGIDVARVMEMIPHRYPFLMVDRIIEIVPAVRATGLKNVSANEPHFMGHFPHHKIMPGVLLIEAMAQTAAVLVVHTLGPDAEGKLVYFMSIDSARFRKPVVPGDSVHIEVEKLQMRGNVWRFAGKAVVAGTVVAEATYAAMILDH